MTSTPYTLLFTGHLLDAAERTSQRFPHHILDEVKSLIKTSVDEVMKLQPIGLAISSLGAGGDMVFAAEMIRREIPLIIFLPFEKERFINASVDYLKGTPDEDPEEWRAEFERILSLASTIRYSHQEKTTKGSNEYARCNSAMLAFAFEKSGGERNLSALALVRPGEEKTEGGSAHFVEEIKSRNVPVQILWPGKGEGKLSDIRQIALFIPVFKYLDDQATHNQTRWRRRLKLTLLILGTIAFFDAFVTVPDHFLFGNGQIVRMVSLVFSMVGAFVTLQMQLSDKTSLNQWTRSRAKAEQIRSEIWFYVFNYWSENNRFGPYSEGELEQYVRQAMPADWKEAVIQLDKVVQLKELVQALSIQERIKFYLAYRLDHQLGYFKSKQKYFANRIKKYKTFTLLFLGVSIVWGTCKMIGEFNPSLSFFMDMSPLGMMISFIALVSSYSEANNSREMEYKYQQMGGGLETLRKRSQSIQQNIDLDEWVKECEVFLRTQNNEWSLKREER